MQKINLEDILPEQRPVKKVWFVAIVWRPNAWKSTFINSLINEKISSVSKRPQTTQKTIKWIYNDDKHQIIFFDTPWIHRSTKDLNSRINKNAIKSLKWADLILRFIDTSRPYWEEDENIDTLLEKVDIPVIKVATKVDINSYPVKNPDILISSVLNKSEIIKQENIEKINQEKKKKTLEEQELSQELLNLIKDKEDKLKLTKRLKEIINIISPYLQKAEIPYSEDFYTDQDIYTRIEEVIREKVFLYAKDELPYNISIKVETLEEEWKKLKILASIFCKTESQKKILIWKKGSFIWLLSKESRQDLIKIFNRPVYLLLKVKVNKRLAKLANI